VPITGTGPALERGVAAPSAIATPLPPVPAASSPPARALSAPLQRPAAETRAFADARPVHAARAREVDAEDEAAPAGRASAKNAKADAAAKRDDRKTADKKSDAAPDATGKTAGKGTKSAKKDDGDEPPARSAKADARDKATKGGRNAKEETASKEKAADKKPSEKAGSERYWVQVASGANKSDLGRAWEKTKARAPKLLGGRPTWTTPWKKSNRLLVGPFKSDEEAQAFVNTLGKAGMGGMQFTSRSGAKVERLSGE
jgi:hypothetical protein